MQQSNDVENSDVRRAHYIHAILTGNWPARFGTPSTLSSFTPNADHPVPAGSVRLCMAPLAEESHALILVTLDAHYAL